MFLGSMETGRLIATILLELSFDSSIREDLASRDLAGKYKNLIKTCLYMKHKACSNTRNEIATDDKETRGDDKRQRCSILPTFPRDTF